MKRRKFLIRLPLLAAGAAISYVALKWIIWNKSPDLDFIYRSRSLLSAIADTIIPKTDSLSASECGVPQFIIQLIIECTDTRSQNKFINGLKDLEEYAGATYRKTFSSCNETERLTILRYLEEKDKISEGRVGRIQAFFTGKPFTMTLREYCVIGYFTSEGGATQALRYSHVPGIYTACEAYTPGEKAWATY